MRRNNKSFTKVRLFGEEYSIKAPDRIPKLYELRRFGRICHLNIEHTEWMMRHANKFRADPLTQEPISFQMFIVIHPDENPETKAEMEKYGIVGDLIIKPTYLKSKSSNRQVYVLDCYEQGTSKSIMQLVCDVSEEVAIPYIIQPNPLPFFGGENIKKSSEIAAAIMLGAKVYLNVTKIGRQTYDETCEYYETPKSDIWMEPYKLFGRDVV